MATLDIDVAIHTADLKRKLAEIPPAQAKALEKAFSKLDRAQNKAFRRAQTDAKKARTDLEKLREVSGSLKSGSLAVAGGFAAIAGSLAGVGAGIDAVMKARLETEHLARVAGTANETIDGLGRIVAGTGGNFASLASGLKRVQPLLDDFRAGNRATVETFAALGIVTEDVFGPDGAVKDGVDPLVLLLDSLSKVEDETKRSALTAEIFGRSYSELNGVLAENGAFKEFLELNNAYGTDVGPAATQAAKEWRAALDLVSFGLGHTTDKILETVDAAFLVKLGAATMINLSNIFDETMKGIGTTLVHVTWLYSKLLSGDIAGAREFKAEHKDTVKNALFGIIDRAEATTRAALAASDALSGMGEAARNLPDFDVPGPSAPSSSPRSSGAPSKPEDLSALSRYVEDQLDSMLTGFSALDREYDKQLAAIAELEATTGDHANAQKARLLAEMAYLGSIDELNQQIADEEAKRTEAADKAREETERREKDAHEAYLLRMAERREAAHAATVAIAEASVGQIESFAALTLSISELVATHYGERSKEARQAALIAFRADQASALASIGFSTAQAIAQALLLGPVAGPIFAGFAAATGAAQAGIVLAQKPPKFFAGLAPDESPAILHSGEAVLNARAVRNLNQKGGSSDTTEIAVVFNDRTIDRMVASAISSNRSEARRALATTGSASAKGRNPWR
jgi:hypothetical protein